MVLLSSLVTYSRITYDVGHRAASINEPAWRLGVQRRQKKKDMMVYSLRVLVEHPMVSSIVEILHGESSIARLYSKFERANGYLFQC